MAFLDRAVAALGRAFVEFEDPPRALVKQLRSLSVDSRRFQRHIDSYRAEAHTEAYQAIALRVHKAIRAFDVEGRRVLDLGCGYGELAALMALSGNEVVGTDVRRPGLRVARAIARGLPARLDVLQGDGTRLALRDGSVDVAYLNEAISHVSDVQGTLRECRRVLRDGGVLIVSDSRRQDLRGWWLLHRTMPRLDESEYVPRRARVLQEAARARGGSLTPAQASQLARRTRGWSQPELEDLMQQSGGAYPTRGQLVHVPRFPWVEPETGMLMEHVLEPKEVVAMMAAAGFSDFLHIPEVVPSDVPLGRLLLPILEVLGIANHGYIVGGRKTSSEG